MDPLPPPYEHPYYKVFWKQYHDMNMRRERIQQWRDANVCMQDVVICVLLLEDQAVRLVQSIMNSRRKQDFMTKYGKAGLLVPTPVRGT